jgi:hypothetical protein
MKWDMDTKHLRGDTAYEIWARMGMLFVRFVYKIFWLFTVGPIEPTNNTGV